MHCDGPVSGFPAVSEYMYVKDLYTNVSRYENNPEPKPKASKRLSIGPRRVVPVRGSFDPRLQDVDPHPLYATASKSSRLSNIILPLHGCQCVQSSRGVARLALASTPPPLRPLLLVHPGWSMWRCTRGQKAGSVSTTLAPRMHDSPCEETCCEEPCCE